MSGFIVVKNYSEKLEVGTIIKFRSQTITCFSQKFSKMPITTLNDCLLSRYSK